jgi:hypothetical protein
MAVVSITCPVLGAHVTRVIDFGGSVTQIQCPEYDTASGRCRLKTAARSSGLLGRLVERPYAQSLDTHSVLCVLRER